MFPPGVPQDFQEMLRQAAEDMGTMDFTPYLLMRGWTFRSHAGQPGLDYLEDPQTGNVILNLIGVSQQLVRDGAEADVNSSDPLIQAFMQHARRAAPLPEPLRTEVRQYRERQKAAGLQNHQPVPAQPEQPMVAPPYAEEPQPPANPILMVNPDALTPVTIEDVQRRRKKKTAPTPKQPEVEIKSPLGRTFSFGDRE